MKASVAALKAFPTFNASLTPGQGRADLSSSTSTSASPSTRPRAGRPGGQGRRQARASSSSRGTRRAVRQGARRQACADRHAGRDFTISSLGGIGGTAFTPIVNAPEVAILGVVRSKMTPVWDGEAFVPRLMLPLCLSYDHRVIDGAAAARFMRHLVDVIEDMRRVLL